MLIIETGAGVMDADSYASDAEFAAMAEAMGWAVPADEIAREALLRRAALQMDALAWQGERAHSRQALAWPRRGVVREGIAVAADSIPANIKRGQMALAAELHAFEVAQAKAASTTGAIVREQVDALSVQYAEPKVPAYTGGMLPVAADAASRALFTGFLRPRAGLLKAVRA